MAPVARELARDHGVVEPLQTAPTLDGLVDELRLTLEAHCDEPATLVGFSWGAWLCYMTAGLHPESVGRLVLVSSGPFEERYAARIQDTRLERLDERERMEWLSLERALADPAAGDKDALLQRLGALASKADAFDPIAGTPGDTDAILLRGEAFHDLWPAAAELRRSGRLLGLGAGIRCPVVAVHGDHDPHPAEGVREPLMATLRDFRFVELEHCGHTPWLERRAKDAFYETLRRECV